MAALVLGGAACAPAAPERTDDPDLDPEPPAPSMGGRQGTTPSGGGGRGGAGGQAGAGGQGGGGGQAGTGGSQAGPDGGAAGQGGGRDASAAEAGGGDADLGERADAAGPVDAGADASGNNPPRPDAAPASNYNPTSTRLPVLWVDVGGKAIVHGTKTTGRVKVIIDHDGTHRDNLASRPAVIDTPMGFAIRGATSRSLPKKSYSLELRDAAGEDKNFPLLDLPTHSDWVLHGGGQDKTILRNALAYTLGAEFGRYAPRTRFVELFIDGRYTGLYVLVEKIRRDRQRVHIPKPAPDEASGDLTGGYIFKMDLAQGRPGEPIAQDWVSAVSPMVYSYYYPRAEEITSAQRNYLRNHVANFERAMMASDWAHPTNGYRKWIDLASWVDFALMQELSNNIDAYQKSLYMQKWPKELGDKIALGPIWDFDFAFGVAPFRDGQRTDIWAWRMNRFGSEPVPYNPPGRVPHVPAYWEKLWMDPGFQNELQCRWRELRRNVITTTNVNAKLDAWTRQVTALAQPRDQARWNNVGAGYQNEVNALKSWIDRRIRWMDANLPGTCNR
jgi:hypothetical protein